MVVGALRSPVTWLTHFSRVGNDGNQGKESGVSKEKLHDTHIHTNWITQKIKLKAESGQMKGRYTLVAHAGFEPATFALLARRSNQLS